ncbi:S-adenosylmethionine decarboxylase related protein [Bacillus clarus]|uniref:S-adenosylmethionine decarboxylase related protein n=1 Tax=Bacillus clarus TaxID=2338372 RepID=A0A090YKC7_9BACI|nr:S-adenosylmethionine decarboxylase related protein [Bacillus clarus]KFM98651.1 saccharopine dehydrogenase family protein [Bacillus clarus]RFT65827.1 S-adenosylmethionine decarboxylase related protein [Bacillus clarus]
MEQFPESFSITLLGSAGGAAKAVLAILNQSVVNKEDPIYTAINNIEFHLVDIKQKDKDYYDELFPNLKDKLFLYEINLQNVVKFKQHLKEKRTGIVIDVSGADTINILSCCNELGICYINSALENESVDKDDSLLGFQLTERYTRFEKEKEKFTNTRSIIGSGMNPGVVQWMVVELMKERPDEVPKACYIVEHDNSFLEDQKLIQPHTLYASWAVERFLDEAILSYPMYMSHHRPLYFYEDVYATEYKVKLGEREFYGCLMPHEEVLILGKIFNMEVGFLYRINEYTTNLIRQNLDRVEDLWNWNRKVFNPAEEKIAGEDLVGVLLVYENSETYMCNIMNSSQVFQKYKTNATYFQVGCGIYAGLSSLLLDEFPQGAYYVEELLLNTKSKYGEYLNLYMKDFVIGCNISTDGLLHDRVRWI